MNNPQEILNKKIFQMYYFPTILEKLEANILKELNINDNLPLDLTKKLFKALQANTSLQSFTYRQHDQDKFINIQKILENNLDLKYFHLDLTTKFSNFFTKSFTNKLRVFKLENYHPNETEIIIINKFILQSEVLEELYLVSNFLSDKINLLAE